jgi:hypothetical protein
LFVEKRQLMMKLGSRVELEFGLKKPLVFVVQTGRKLMTKKSKTIVMIIYEHIAVIRF